MPETPKPVPPKTVGTPAKKNNTVLIIVLVIIGVLLIGGIGGCLVIRGCLHKVSTEGVENALEKATGTDINTEDGKVSVKSEEGNLEIGSKELPSGFADKISVYTNASVDSSSKYEDKESGTSYVVSMKTNDSYDSVKAFFKSNLPANNWPIISETESTTNGKKSVTFTFNSTKDPGEGWIVIAEEDSGVSIGYSVTFE